MLTQLTIQKFAIVKFLELELHAGMTCITGEAGTGESSRHRRPRALPG